jgi:hypothetical protein
LETWSPPYLTLAELSVGFGTISVSDFNSETSFVKIFIHELYTR